MNKPLLSTRIGEAATLGILFGVLVIVLSWALTAAYVAWSNVHYDREAARLCDRLRS